MRLEMAMGQIQQRKRRCRPKVKTGCGTCKIRRIKCDEAKPSCQRCSMTGRNCDGYSSDVAISSQPPKNPPGLIQRISVHISGNVEEKRGFDFFLWNTAAELSGYYDSSFWEKLILAASAQSPSLRHAVIAIGALHEDFSRKRLAPSASSAEDQRTQFALDQYAKALGALRRSLSSGKEEPLTALMSCVLFVCFDSLRGWFDSAMVHLQSGLRILRDMRRSSLKGNHFIEDNIAPLLVRLSLQSIIHVESRSAPYQTAFARNLMGVSGKEIVISEGFESLEEARNALNQAASGLFRVFHMWEFKQARADSKINSSELPIASQSTESLAIFDKYTAQLSLWNLAFDKFMVSKSKDFTSRQVRGAALLKIHHTAAKIMAGARPDVDDSDILFEAVKTPLFEAVKAEYFMRYLDDFQIVITLSRSLIAAAEEDTKSGKPPLTFSTDLGLIGPLYYTCLNGPTASIKTTAMELLLRCPRREGMWNSVFVAQMIQEYWELDAKHKEAQELGVEVDEFGSLVPFRDTFDRNSVHRAYFGRPTEMETAGISYIPDPEVATPEPATSSQYP